MTPDRLQFYQLGVLIVAVTGGLYFMLFWFRDRYRAREYERKRLERQEQFERDKAASERERLERQEQLEMKKSAAEYERLERQEHFERERLARQQKQDEHRFAQEQKMRDVEYQRLAQEVKRAEEVARESAAGMGSGGYIVIDMAEQQRPLFHDLLKGFEDYAKLRGYHLSFSIDSSFDGRIAFKFTVRNSGVAVGTERVRKDFHDYLEQVRGGSLDDLDNLPVIASLEEHNLLVALLKNRISFLQHSYTLSRNAVQYYESLLAQARTFPALPAQSIVVHTGGQMDSRNYNAVNSSRLIQGEGNTNTDSSTNINIGSSFNEKQARIAQLDTLLKHLEKAEGEDESARTAGRELSKVKDELTESNSPDASAIARWMHRAKDLLSTAKVGAEVAEAAHKLYETFGLS